MKKMISCKVVGKPMMDVERIFESFEAHCENAYDVMEKVTSDDDFSQEDVTHMGELRALCMSLASDVDQLVLECEQIRRRCGKAHADELLERVEEARMRLDDVLDFEALLAGAFSASLRYVEAYPVEEEFLDAFMDDGDLNELGTEGCIDEEDMSETELREFLKKFMHESTSTEGFASTVCARGGHEDRDVGRYGIDVHLVCGSEIPSRFEALLEESLRKAVHTAARRFAEEVRA